MGSEADHSISYGAVIDEENGKKVYPEIYFRDQEGVVKIVNVKDASFIQDDGNKVVIKLPAEFQKSSAKFPLDIAIRHPTTNPNPDFPLVENAIDLISGFQITGIDKYNESGSLIAYLNWAGFRASAEKIFLNRKLSICEISSLTVSRINCDRAMFLPVTDGVSVNQYRQPEGSITDVFKTFPVITTFTEKSPQAIQMPYDCLRPYIFQRELDPNIKYKVEWEIFLEKREFNLTSGLYEPIERTKTVNFSYDCSYNQDSTDAEVDELSALHIISVTQPQQFVFYKVNIGWGGQSLDLIAPEISYEGFFSGDLTIEAQWIEKKPIEFFSTTEFEPMEGMKGTYNEDIPAYYCRSPRLSVFPSTEQFTVNLRLKDKAGHISNVYPFSYTCTYK